MARELCWKQLLFSKRRKEIHDRAESLNTGVGREEIERDYDRILFSAPIRRLADKTQVFPMDKNDSIRTRLTHSHEVSNLARSIGVRLAYPPHRQQVFGACVDHLCVERTVPSLLAAVGLVHDLGNPPFGHQGEKSIRRWFKEKNQDNGSIAQDFLAFDGNCQTFRLLTKLQILNDTYGLNLTYATLAGLLKYPVFSDSVSKHGFMKFGIFDSERDIAVTMEMLWHGIVHCKTEGGTENRFAQYAYGGILENYRRVYESTERHDTDKQHLLCDAISGMTEQFLVSLHGELKELKPS